MIRAYGTSIYNADILTKSESEKVLHPLFAEITKEDNGDYYIELEDVLDNRKYYEQGTILLVTTPWGYEGSGQWVDQCFRCDNPRIQNDRIYCKAWHIFYDSENYVIAEKFERNDTCAKVLSEYKNYTDKLNGFSVSSDITTKEPTTVERQSLYEVFAYLAEVYKGHWVRNNNHLSIQKKIGEDRGVVLAYNKNVTDIKAEENWDDVCTKILPYTEADGKEITLYNAVGGTSSYYLKSYEKDEDNPYNIPYTKVVKFENKLEKKDYTTETEYFSAVKDWLHSTALAYLEANQVPKVNYSVSGRIDNISDIGDIIHVKHPKCKDKIDILTEVISIKYDAIAEKYTKIEFGNFRKEVKKLTDNVVSVAVKNSEKKITDFLASGNVIISGSEILVVDKLPKEKATKCLKIDKTGISVSNGINSTFRTIIGIDGTISQS